MGMKTSRHTIAEVCLIVTRLISYFSVIAKSFRSGIVERVRFKYRTTIQLLTLTPLAYRPHSVWIIQGITSVFVLPQTFRRRVEKLEYGSGGVATRAGCLIGIKFSELAGRLL